MPIAQWKYTEGTIKNPQHTKSTEACFTATDKVHFPDGRFTAIPNYYATSINLNFGTVTGICRSQWALKRAGVTDIAGAYYLFGTHTNLYAIYRGIGYNITPLVTTATATLTANPLAVVDTTPTITVTYAAHGLVVGDRIKLSAASDTGGILAAAINKEHIVKTIPTANTFTITAATNATSTTSGGGASVQIFKAIASGNAYQALGSGPGYGLPGEGLPGIGGFAQSEQAYPRIWSFDNFGTDTIMCAGDYTTGDGQKIYIWDGDRDVAPSLLTNAPTNCNWVLTVAGSVVALCGSQIRISELNDATVWTGITTQTFEVTRSDKLVSGFAYSDKVALIFAPHPYLLRVVGDVWELDELQEEYPIAAPMACCKYRDGLIWYSSDGNFYFFNGSNVERIVNEQNGEYVRRNLNSNAIWTCFMMADPKHDQAWLFFPTGSSQNPNEYVIINPRRYAGGGKASFTLGTFDRTSGQRPVSIDDAFYMMNEDESFLHFGKGETNIPWEATTALFFLDGSNRYKMTRLIPDAYRSGNMNIEIFGTESPQGVLKTYSNKLMTEAQPYTNCIAAGKMFSFKFSGTEDIMIGDLQIDVKPMGGGLL